MATYNASAAVTGAEETLEEHKKKKPGAYQSVWGEQLSGIMDRILNREFHYNMNEDALYRQYRDQAVRDGRMAMMDTMGQAAALTGGYGSTYAQTAGQQAYSRELQKLGDRIPELFALALEQYRVEGEGLDRQFSLISGQEDRDYGRWKDDYTAWEREQDRLQGELANTREEDYRRWRDTVADEHWQKEFDEDLRRFLLEWEDKHPQPDPNAQQQTQVVYVPAPAPKPEEKVHHKERNWASRKTRAEA